MIHIVALDSVPAQPWKNGGGTTRELLAWPTPADWLLRLSVARIDRDGPFSAYPGISRWFAVLSGPGVELTWQDRAAHVGTGTAPLHFDGGDAPGCRLLGGPTEDLNLMLRNDRVRGGLAPAKAGEAWHAAAGWRGVYSTEACTLQCHDSTALPARSLAWAPDAAAGPWQLSGPAALRAWWIHLEPLAP